MDLKCETRPCSKRHGLKNDPGDSLQWEVETPCKSLIVGGHLTEEKIIRRSHLNYRTDIYEFRIAYVCDVAFTIAKLSTICLQIKQIAYPLP